MVNRPCGCPPISVITDPQRHDQWHTLVIVQGGPAGRCNAETLRETRGIG